MRIAAGGNAIAVAERGRIASCHNNILLLANFLLKTETLLDGEKSNKTSKGSPEKEKRCWH